MEDYVNTIELLLKRAVDYGKTSYDLMILKALNKTSDIVSLFISQSLVFGLITAFMFFFNIGLAFWVGELLGKFFFGFFAVAAFYGIIGIVFRVFFYNITKKKIKNYIIRNAIK